MTSVICTRSFQNSIEGKSPVVWICTSKKYGFSRNSAATFSAIVSACITFYLSLCLKIIALVISCRPTLAIILNIETDFRKFENFSEKYFRFVSISLTKIRGWFNLVLESAFKGALNMKKLTLDEIGKLAGVSRATVSR